MGSDPGRGKNVILNMKGTVEYDLYYNHVLLKHDCSTNSSSHL